MRTGNRANTHLCESLYVASRARVCQTSSRRPHTATRYVLGIVLLVGDHELLLGAGPASEETPGSGRALESEEWDMDKLH